MSRMRNPWVLIFVGTVLVGIILRVIPVRPLFDVDVAPDPTTQQLRTDLAANSTLDIDMSAVAERPLFNVARRAPKVPAAPVVQKVQEVIVRAPAPVLMGTMKNRQGVMIAYVRFGDAVDSVRLEVGGFRDPWEVESIGDGVARLRNGENIVELKLDKD